MKGGLLSPTMLTEWPESVTFEHWLRWPSQPIHLFNEAQFWKWVKWIGLWLYSQCRLSYTNRKKGTQIDHQIKQTNTEAEVHRQIISDRVLKFDREAVGFAVIFSTYSLAQMIPFWKLFVTTTVLVIPPVHRSNFKPIWEFWVSLAN